MCRGEGGTGEVGLHLSSNSGECELSLPFKTCNGGVGGRRRAVPIYHVWPVSHL